MTKELGQLLERLLKAEVECVLVGGLAATAHGSSLVTRDVDVCVRFTESNLMRLQDALEGLHAVHRVRPDLPLALTPAQCAGLKHLCVKTDLGVIDCLGAVLGVGDFKAVLARSILIELPFGLIRILDLDTLIQAEKAMGRPHDLITVQHLEAVKRRKSAG